MMDAQNDDRTSETLDTTRDDQKSCFIVCPIGSEGDDVRRRSDQVKRHIIDPVLTGLGYKTIRSDLVDESGLIGTHIVNQLLTADLVVADLTGSNPNVFYELALRHAFAKPFVQIIDKNERLPFDVVGQRSIFFDYRDLDSAEEARNRLRRAVVAIHEGGDDYKTESPVSQAVDLQQLKSSGNPEQVTMAEVSESLSEIRAELRSIRPTFARSTAAALPHEQWEVVRGLLFEMAKEGRVTLADYNLLETAPDSKSFSAFKSFLRKRITEHDPWGTSNKTPATSNGTWGSADEPPF